MRLRDLPAVDELAARLGGELPAPLATDVVRRVVDRSRAALLADPNAAVDPETEASDALAVVAAGRLRPLLNATGVLLHTNLGRAPLAQSAITAAAEAWRGYSNLEFDVASGVRGKRGTFARDLLRSLTGAQDAVVVNNNAGALLLALMALAGNDEVLVSRGELIEIGGSFRLPDIMAASGATLREIGTTNRTKLSDYEPHVAGASLVLKVHPSNYRIDGFTTEAGYAELADLAHAAGIPMVADVGSGLLDGRTSWLSGPPPAWVSEEPAVLQTLESGADVVLFSGDKLLGGPQAGIAVGNKNAIERMAKHPAARALRPDGATLAALAATLELYASGHAESIPFWRMATASYEGLERRAVKVVATAGIAAEIVRGESVPGAGSVPGVGVPSPIISISGRADAMWRRLLDDGVVARRHEGRVQIDMRTIEPADDARVAQTLAVACR